jgi:GrpB-like predicted nucleotidyltransferase (UPF0157 family)
MIDQTMLIQEYNKGWIENFHKISQVINESLFNLHVSIEHVGSASVPELAAKPIIDIDVVFASNVEFDMIKMSLEQIGYINTGNQGIPGREVFKRDKLITKHEILDFIAHHLYVCPKDSDEFKKHILFRDYLMVHKEARFRYQNLKYRIAEVVNQDRKKYAQLKEQKASNFINSNVLCY